MSSSDGQSGQAPNSEASVNPVKLEDFLNSGRTGRRNAVPDIYLARQGVSTSELPADFSRLSCDEAPPSPQKGS